MPDTKQPPRDDAKFSQGPSTGTPVGRDITNVEKEADALLKKKGN